MIDVTTIEDGDNSSAEIENKLFGGHVAREVSEAEIFAAGSSSFHPAIPSLVVGDNHHLRSSRKNITPVMNNPGKVLSAMVGITGGPSLLTTTAPKQSVIPQLMDIYNDLAQSSTPQTTSSLTTATMTQYQQFHQQQQQHQEQGGSGGGGLAAGTTNNTISARDFSMGSSSSQASKGSASKRRRARSGSTSSSNNRVRRSNNTAPGPTKRNDANVATIKSENSFEQQGDAVKQSLSSNRGKKGKVSSADNRWSKRFTWPDEVSMSDVLKE